jgi:DNA (cytosine-5)-methyltransferase 1
MTNATMFDMLKSNKKENKINLKFMDFCAGIGAGRLGLEKNGLECVGFSEVDKEAEKTYRLFFGESEKNYGDLTKIDPKTLPDFEMMIAGFPCQTFSVIGKRKGMDDERGQIIFSLINIMLAKNVRYFILENVKGLTSHDGGHSLRVILDQLDKAGYAVVYDVLNSLNYGVPQMRERIYFVGIRKDLVDKDFYYQFPESQSRVRVADYLIDDMKLELDDKKDTYDTFLKYLNNKYNRGQYSVSRLLENNYNVIDTRQSDLRIYEDKVPTLRTGRHGILYVRNNKFRKLSGFESLLLQGFPREVAVKVKNKVEEIHLLKQTGNAMTVSVIEAVGKQLFRNLKISA